MEELSLLGIFFVLVGLALILINSFKHFKGRMDVGGIVLIGPFPIIFGSSKEMIIFVVLISILLIVLFLMLWHLVGRFP